MSKPQKTPQKKGSLLWSRKTRIVTGISILVFSIVVVLHHVDYHDRLSPGLQLGDVSVGGMDYETFARRWQEHYNHRGSMMVVYNDRRVDAGLSNEHYDQIINDLWELAYADSDAKTWLGRLWIHMIRWIQPHSLGNQDLQGLDIDNFDTDPLYDLYSLKSIHEGKLAYTQSGIIMEPSSPGVHISDELLQKNIIQTFVQNKEQVVVLPIVTAQPRYTAQEIEELSKTLLGLLEHQRVLQHARLDREYYLEAEELKKLLTVSYNFTNDQFVLGFDGEVLHHIAQQFAPENARVSLDDNYYVQLKSGEMGVVVDEEELRELLRSSFDQPDKILMLKKGKIIEPEEMISRYQDYDLKHLVSEFTTYHGCCAARVDNIQRIADMLDGQLLAPGETLNINEIIGERTEASGFKPAGSIFKGKLVDSVGGGISQFITTLHNAVYWGGYEIITHKPHSIYFSRYPKGIEATINWPYVDYIFRNDTESYIMIDTEYTDTSITVRILGNNKDRVFIGEHKGYTRKNVLRTSPEARQVISHVSAPYNYRDPLVRYENDPTIARGEQIIDQEGGLGWSVLVERKVMQNGEIIHHNNKPVHYISEKDTVIRVHPCDNPSEFIASCYSQ